MIDPAAQQDLLERLHLPAANLTTLSFCAQPTPAQVRTWIESLPLTRINFVSAVLYSALPELARLNTDGEIHLQLLEIVRPVAQSCIGALSHTFINQPLILPAHAMKAATVAQALQKHLSNAYLGALRGTINSKPQPENIALAIHRTLTGFGLLLLRSYQLYTPAFKQLWVEIHTLYQLAETYGVHQLQVRDPLQGHQQVRTIEQAYVRILLLAAARPNQLRQQDMATVYQALETLSSQARVVPYQTPSTQHTYLALLDTAQPPIYHSRLELYDSKEVRKLDTRELLYTLEQARAGRLEFSLDSALVAHLISTLAQPAQRVFDREARSGQLEVSIGLSNVHFHTAGGMPFTLFINPDSTVDTDNSLFQRHRLSLKPTADNDTNPWGEAFDIQRPSLNKIEQDTSALEEQIRLDSLARYRGQHPIVTLDIVDASASGYGLSLREQPGVALKSGELVCVREPGHSGWAIAVVRWVRRGKNHTYMGIQILAPQAQAAAVAIIQKTGDQTEYQRALLLPALRMVAQPETLLTNALSFQEHSKIKLLHEGQSSTVQLTKRLLTTGTVSQFSFRQLAASTEPPSHETNLTENSASWDILPKN